MTTKAVQFRRGSSNQHLTFTGLDGEVTVDTDKNVVRVHDGATVGGFSSAREDLSNVSQDAIAAKGVAKDDLSNVPSSAFTDQGLALADLTNVTQQTVADMGIAKDDLSNVTSGADATETSKGLVELATVAEAAAGTDTVRAVTPVGVSAAIANHITLPRNFISGLVMSNAADVDHDIRIDVGMCRDFLNSFDISLASSLTKKLDSNWESGNNCGGLPSDITLNPDDTYHLFIISNGVTVDAGFDTALDATNLLTDATGYTYYRRIGSVTTDASSNIIPFTVKEQAGGSLKVDYLSPIIDNTGSSLPKGLVDLSVPTGITVEADVVGMFSGEVSTYGSFVNPVLSDYNDTVVTAKIVSTNSGYTAKTQDSSVVTNVNGQVRFVLNSQSNANTYLAVPGYTDQRV